MKALKAKLVGIGVYGSSNDVVARMMLERSGIDPDKETKLSPSAPTAPASPPYKEGLVEAAIIAPPADAQARKLGLQRSCPRQRSFQVSAYRARHDEQETQGKSPGSHRVIRAFIKANRFVRDNRQEAINILVDWGRTQREDAIASYDSTWQVFSPDGTMPEDGMRLVIDDAQKALKATRHVIADQRSRGCASQRRCVKRSSGRVGDQVER